MVPLKLARLLVEAAPFCPNTIPHHLLKGENQTHFLCSVGPGAKSHPTVFVLQDFLCSCIVRVI